MNFSSVLCDSRSMKEDISLWPRPLQPMLLVLVVKQLIRAAAGSSIITAHFHIVFLPPTFRHHVALLPLNGSLHPYFSCDTDAKNLKWNTF